MEERRIIRIGESMKTFAEVDRQVTPIIGKCLDEITKAVDSIDPKHDSQLVIDAFKSGFEPPGDVDFEDFTQPIKRAVSESSLSNSKETKSESRFSSKSKGKLWPFMKKSKLMSLLTPPYQPPPLPPSTASPSALPNGPQSPKQPKEPLSHRFNEFMTSKPKIHCFRSLKRGGGGPEDYSNLPPEQRRKKLQQKRGLNENERCLHQEPSNGGRSQQVMRRQSGVYEPQSNTLTVTNCVQDRESPDGGYTEEPSQESEMKTPTAEFDDEFDDEEPLPTIGTCKALYTFEGQNEGTISVTEGETLYVIEEDKGDGWTRIRRNEDEEGYCPVF
ncbi:Formin-binding protein 1, partial [Ophiophagus hannah]